MVDHLQDVGGTYDENIDGWFAMHSLVNRPNQEQRNRAKRSWMGAI